MKTLNEHIGELEKQLKSFSFDKIRSKCLYPNCNEDAIYSHSIQENGILDNLEDNIEKAGRKVYSIEDYPDIDFKEKHISTFLRAKRKLRSFGKNDASGLYMFCSKHDKEIFRDIEDIYFENSQRQLFLHSIRAYLFDTRKDFLMYSFTEDKLKTLSELPKSLEMLNKLTKQLDVILKGLPDDYIISEFNLISTSIFYADEKFYKWQVYDGEFLLYDSGWGGEGELIGDFSNGSTFDNIYLGMNNIDIINLLYSMGFYIKKRTLSIAHSVMDENNKISKKTIKYFLNETD